MLATLLDFPAKAAAQIVNGLISPPPYGQANGGPSDNDEIFRGMVDMARGLSAHWRDKAARKAAGELPASI